LTARLGQAAEFKAQADALKAAAAGLEGQVTSDAEQVRPAPCLLPPPPLPLLAAYTLAACLHVVTSQVMSALHACLSEACSNKRVMLRVFTGSVR
jgi:hypothetical protein